MIELFLAEELVRLANEDIREQGKTSLEVMQLCVQHVTVSTRRFVRIIGYCDTRVFRLLSLPSRALLLLCCPDLPLRRGRHAV